jgi:hypothetical protein
MKSIKTSMPSRLVALLAGAALFGLATQSALAVGTPSNTDITNQASLAYSVGAVVQAPVLSSISTFKVDNKVNLTVAKVSDNATVVPNSTDNAIAFTVDNIGNTSQSYALTATVNGVPTASFNNVRIYLDNDSSGTLTVGDTLYVDATTFGTVAPGGQLKVLIVADQKPTIATNGQTAAYNLVAQTTNAGTTTVTADLGVADTAGVDVVWADIAGSDGGDGAKDGKHSAFATYTVSITVPTVAKTALLLCDPFNGNSNPKNIPGATVRYTMLVTNPSASPIVLSTIIDDLTVDGNTTFEPNLVTAASACATAESAAGSGFKRTSTRTGEVAGPTYYTTTNGDADGADATAGVVTVDFSKVLPVIAAPAHAAGELLPGETATVIFNVTIN